MRRELDDHPEMEPVYVVKTLGYLERTSRDRYNDDIHSDRYRIYERLFSIERGTLAKSIPLFRRVILTKLESDPVESFRLIEVLSLNEFLEDALSIASAGYTDLPEIRSLAWPRGFLNLTIKALEVAILCRAGMFDDAVRCIDALVG
jgi:hypothetical protein